MIALSAQTIAQAAAQLQFATLAPLLPPGVEPADIFPRFWALCVEQEYRIARGLPISILPLHVVASLEHLGYRVEIETGRIVGWPVNGLVEVIRS